MTTTPPTVPLHAAFLLLAHDPATGKCLVDDTHLKPALAGAGLLELTRTGSLRLEGEGRQTRLRATGGHVPAELAESLERADGRSPKDAVARIGGTITPFKDRAGHLRDATWRRLEVEGVVRPTPHRLLGVFPTTRWVQLTGRRAELVDALRSAVDGQARAVRRAGPEGAAEHDRRTAGDGAVAALVCVAEASGVLRRLFPDVPRKELSARAAAVSGDLWGGPAVARAISDINAAIVAGTAAAVSAAAIGSG